MGLIVTLYAMTNLHFCIIRTKLLVTYFKARIKFYFAINPEFIPLSQLKT